MDRSDRVRFWIEIISALGVILGLALVAWELRQSTAEVALNRRAVETAAYQDLVGQISDLNRIVVEDVDFAALQLESALGPLRARIGGIPRMREACGLAVV